MQIVHEYYVKKTDGCWKTSGLPIDEVNIMVRYTTSGQNIEHWLWVKQTNS